MIEFHSLWVYSSQICNCSVINNNIYPKQQSITITEYEKAYGFTFISTSFCWDYCMNPLYERDASHLKYDVRYSIDNNNNNNKSKFTNIDPSNGLFLFMVNGQIAPRINLIKNQWYRFQMINANSQYFIQPNFKILSNICDVWLLGNDGIFFKNGPRNIMTRKVYNYQIFLTVGSRADIGIRCNKDLENLPIILSNRTNGTSPIGMWGGTFPYPPQNTTLFTLSVYDFNQSETVETKIKFTGIHNRRVDTSHLDTTTNARDYNHSKVNTIGVESGGNNYPPLIVPKYPSYLIDTLNNNDTGIQKLVRTECPCYTYKFENMRKVTYQDRCHLILYSKNAVNGTVNSVIWNVSRPLMYIEKGYVYDFVLSILDHPLHIHTNPFQIVNVPINFSVPYMAQIGDWRDSIAIPPTQPIGAHNNIRIRMPVIDFDGSYITHCHFLPHEDSGMIQYFDVVDKHDYHETNDVHIGTPNKLNSQFVGPNCTLF